MSTFLQAGLHSTMIETKNILVICQMKRKIRWDEKQTVKVRWAFLSREIPRDFAKRLAHAAWGKFLASIEQTNEIYETMMPFTCVWSCEDCSRHHVAAEIAHPQFASRRSLLVWPMKELREKHSEGEQKLSLNALQVRCQRSPCKKTKENHWDR